MSDTILSLEVPELLAEMPDTTEKFTTDQMVCFEMARLFVSSLDKNDLELVDGNTALTVAVVTVMAYLTGQGMNFQHKRDRPLLVAFLGGYCIETDKIMERKLTAALNGNGDLDPQLAAWARHNTHD